jgi:hypothetical protein
MLKMTGRGDSPKRQDPKRAKQNAASAAYANTNCTASEGRWYQTPG